MARYKKGINGPISGKIGNVVGSSWNGIDYLKQKPVRTAPPTEGELKNRFVFELVHNWVHPLLEFVRIGFKNYSPTNYGYNAAKSLLNSTALHKDGFDSSIDPSKVFVSYGDLPVSADLKTELEENELVFTWDSSIGKNMNARDQVMLLAYDPQDQQLNYTLSGQFRYTGRDVLELNFLKPGTYHVYAAFRAEDRESQSMSVYLGTVELD